MGSIRAGLVYSNPRFDLCGVVDTDYDGASALAGQFSAIPFKSLTEAIAHFGTSEKRLDSLAASKPLSLSSSSWKNIARAPIPSASAAFSSSANPLPIDGVIISSPTFTHDEVINEAVRNGISIFTEKPVDETAEKIKKLFAACEKSGVNLCCGFQRRFDESYVSAAHAVQEGNIGRPLTSSIFFADHPCPPIEFLLTGGNIFSDLSAHDVDYIRWVLDDEVVSVYATGTSSSKVLEDAGVHDNATMVMKFQKGAVVTLTMSRSACYGYDQRCEIFGEKGLASVGNEHTNTCVVSNGSGVHHSTLKYSFPQRFNAAFASELNAFADTVLLEKPWPVTATDCIAVQQVSDAARESCDSQQIVQLA